MTRDLALPIVHALELVRQREATEDADRTPAGANCLLAEVAARKRQASANFSRS